MPRCQKPLKFTQLWTLVGPHFRSSVDYRSLRFSSHRGARLIWLGSACRPEWHRRCLHTAPAPRRCSNWLVIRSTWEPTSDFSACSIRGDRTSRFILTHTTVPTSDPVFDGFRWIDSSLRFFLLVRALSEVFRSKFCEQLREMFQQDRLQLHGSLQQLALLGAFGHFLWKLGQNDSVVYAKPPFGGAELVLTYMARYTYRIVTDLTNPQVVRNGGSEEIQAEVNKLLLHQNVKRIDSPRLSIMRSAPTQVVETGSTTWDSQTSNC
jgi:hypothetical protein